MAYSYDLRKKALDYIEKGGLKTDASQVFGVTVPTIFNWIKRKKEGYLAPFKKRNRKPHKIDGEKLKVYIEEYPDSYLREIAEFFGTSITAVFKACKRLKITLKKRHLSIRNETRKKEKNFKKN